ncbi:hypothetical protein [Caenimonas soli]|uniref:hypothetical protein n=1 Tax=Caenimonas soli TaxID=2735555 RepID=UPI001552D3B0|nr:hypothetical protein [Caenimonas soli]NPC58871.1 hypothetical protein [Caenimonas soli]
MRLILLLALSLALAGCGSKPREPDWQMNAHGALERYAKAYLGGNARVEASEFERARNELESTGQPGLVARAELTRCALRVASLVFEPCEGFERLRADSPAAERAYADYVAGTIAPADVALLPPQHRAAASAQGGAAAVKAIEDPVARLIAAGVLFRRNQATPDLLALAADTASAQGWRRPLLAWLGVAAQRAEQAGAPEEAQRLRRRMALAAGER